MMSQKVQNKISEKTFGVAGRTLGLGKIIVAGVILVILLLVGAYFWSQNPGYPNIDITRRKPPVSLLVKTLTVDSNAYVNNALASFPGKVRAGKRVNLSFELAGLIIELPVTESMRVKKGQLLAKIDPRNYENDLLSAKASYEEAKLNYERAQRLHKEGVIPHSTLEKAEAAFHTMQANVKICEKSLEDTEIHAPFDGTVAKRFVENHKRISPFENIIALQDNSTIEVVIHIPETIMAIEKNYPRDRALQVTFDAIPGKNFLAHIYEFKTDADSETQTYEVVLDMPSPLKYNILPGMTASVFLPRDKFEQKNEGILCYLPAEAIIGDAQNQKSCVFCISPTNNALVRKEITVGSPVELGIPVLSGLAEKDVVVVAGSKYLKEGMLVRPMDFMQPPPQGYEDF